MVRVDDADAVIEATASGPPMLQLPPDGRRDVLEVWPWAGPLLDAVRAIAADEPGRETGRTVAFGASINQTSIVSRTKSERLCCSSAIGISDRR